MIKYLTAFLLGCLFVSLVGILAMRYEKASSPYLVRSFKNMGNWDSVYLYSDGHINITRDPVKRYFFVSYQTDLVKGGTSSDYGHLWFPSDSFPTKNQIDSMVGLQLTYSRDCYQGIVIRQIFEFKNREDYEVFGQNYSGTPLPKVHKICDKNKKSPS